MKKLITLTAAFMCCTAMPAIAADMEKANAKADYHFNMADTNKDKSVSKTEWNATGDKMFKDADTDKSGTLNAAEMSAHKLMEMEKFHASYKPAAKEEMNAAQKKDKVDAMTKMCLTEADKDGNAQLSKEEWNAYGEKMFTDADTNNDGKLNMEEMRAATVKEMDKHAVSDSNANPQTGTVTGTQTGSDKR